MSSTSLAAVFHGAGQPLVLDQLPLPALQSGEVLVKVTCCTLCGSDLHTFEGRRSTPVPTILGHEILGRIEAFGPGEPVRDFHGNPLEIGQRVTWSIAASCHDCFYCERDLPQKCEQLFKYGHEQINDRHALSGGLAEYCHLAKGTPIISLPDDLPDAVACPSNCATATVVAAIRVGQGCRDQTVLIQGAGMLGLTACALARSLGAREVLVSDVQNDRLELARSFGATRCVCVADDAQALVDAVHESTNGRGVDLVLELSGSSSAMQLAPTLLRIGGNCVLVGAVFPGPSITIDPEMVVRRWLNIHGVHNYAPQDLDQAVTFLVENHQRHPFESLVKESFELIEVNRAFDHALKTRAPRIAVRP
jgi:alcohol dehydrogenase